MKAKGKNEKLYLVKVFPKKLAEKNLLFLNKKQLEFWGLKLNQELKLTVGFTDLIVEVMEQDFDLSLTSLYLSPKARDELSYYQGEALCLTFISESQMILGLTLGLTLPLKTYSKINKYYVIKKRALLALEKGIFLYCICPELVDNNSELVEAFSLDPQNYQWVKRNLPYPQVFYTRSRFPRESFSNKLWINTIPYFEKWSIYQALDSHEATRSYQPETALLSLEKLNEFLLKYQCSFIKNIYGRGGRQVKRVEMVDNQYFCKFGGLKIKKRKFSNLNNLYSYLQNTLGKDLIIQQGIFLKRLDNHPFDLRVLAQKNITGNWLISALSFRIAQPDAIVTNIASGAREVVITSDDKLPCSDLSWEQLQDFCLNVLTTLEASMGPLGEVGLDVGLDEEGKLWLIEANSHPSSRGYREATSMEVCNKIFGLPLDYAKYLVRKNYKNPS